MSTRAGPVWVLALMLLVAGASSASTTYTFGTSPGTFDSVWDGLKLTTTDTGGYTNFSVVAPGAVPRGVKYVWSDYNVNDGTGASPPDTPQAEPWDVEGIFVAQTDTQYKILVVQSLGEDLVTGVPHSGGWWSDYDFWRGDLAINPGGLNTAPQWNTAGGNTAKLSVKTGGLDVGKAKLDALWGYGAGHTSVSHETYRDPLEYANNSYSSGYRPSDLPSFGDPAGASWGSNFKHDSGSDATVDYHGELLGDMGDGTTAWVNDYGYQTYAYQVSFDKSLLGSTGLVGIWSGTSCLNDGLYWNPSSATYGAPEPASIVLIGALTGAGALLRRRRRRLA